MSNRFGREHNRLPHCLRQLPENQPRNRQEYLIRKALNPQDVDAYFDKTGNFLYDTKCMSQELERIKMSRTQALNIVSNHAQFLKRLIMDEKEKPQVDIASMRARYMQARAKASQSLLSVDEMSKSEDSETGTPKSRNSSSTVRSTPPRSSTSSTTNLVSPSGGTKN